MEQKGKRRAGSILVILFVGVLALLATLWARVEAARPPLDSSSRVRTSAQAADEPRLVKDIHTTSYGSDPQQLVLVDDTVYFTANHEELWRSDGTGSGTVLVRDFGEEDGYSGYHIPQELAAMNGMVYFSAGDEAHGRELWRSDGTEAGTVMVKDIFRNFGSGEPRHLTVVADVLYFAAYDEVAGQSLWRSDGSEGGTVLVTAMPDIQSLFSGGTFLYVVTDDYSQSNLWRSDGTAAGTTVLAQFSYSYWSATPSWFTLVDGILYFAARDDSSGQELWRSDGTAAGTFMVKDIYPGEESPGTPHSSSPYALVGMDGILYFAANDDADYISELWRSDGTDTGTYMVKDVHLQGDLWNASSPVVVGNTFYFVGEDMAGAALWRSDGTQAGTTLLKDIDPGWYGSAYSHLTAAGGVLYFRGNDRVSGEELWKSNGTAAGTILVKDIYPGDEYPGYPHSSAPADLVTGGTLLYFTAGDGPHGRELWRSDGSEAGTTLVKDIGETTYSARPQALTSAGSTLYLYADDGLNGQELWRSDGTANGTTLVEDIWPGPECSYDMFSCPQPLLVEGGDTLYLAADDGTHGTELWRSDGTAAGTTMVKDIRPGSPGSLDTGTYYSDGAEMFYLGGTLFFKANDGEHGAELWRSDGTETGTKMVKDIWSQADYSVPASAPADFVALGSTLFFTAEDGQHGRELWRSDGTEAGTEMVKDIHPNSSGLAEGTRFAVLDSILYFVADDGAHASELWRSDGTEEGTYLVRDLNPTGSSIFSGDGGRGPVVAGDTLFFAADDGTNGNELWRSDGTESGTEMVKDIASDWGAEPRDLTPVNAHLYFTADDGLNGRELWRSDGTEAGTVLVKDIGQGTVWDSWPRNLADMRGTLFFSAEDAIHGRELWQSDGSEDGTVMVADLNPGSAGSSPRSFTVVDESLFFVADDGSHGEELWQMSAPPPQPPAKLALAGPALGGLNTAYTFTASVGTFTATLPLTYEWQATGQMPVTNIVDNLNDSVTFSWTMAGTKQVTVTASNGSGTVSATHTVQVVEGTLLEVAPDEPATLVVTSAGLTATLSIPAGAVTEQTTLVYRPLEDVTATGDLLFAGRAFDLTAYRDGALLPALLFAEPLSLTLFYDGEAIAEIDPTALRLYRWTGGAWQEAGTACTAPEEQTVDIVAAKVTAPLCQTGRFALLGPAAERHIFLPLVIR